jgi:hypothetical protein
MNFIILIKLGIFFYLIFTNFSEFLKTGKLCSTKHNFLLKFNVLLAILSVCNVKFIGISEMKLQKCYTKLYRLNIITLVLTMIVLYYR